MPDKNDGKISGKVMACHPDLVEKLADWAARVLPKAVERKLKMQTSKEIASA